MGCISQFAGVTTPPREAKRNSIGTSLEIAPQSHTVVQSTFRLSCAEVVLKRAQSHSHGKAAFPSNPVNYNAVLQTGLYGIRTLDGYTKVFLSSAP